MGFCFMNKINDLSPTEIADYKEVFRFFDKDGDGTISVSEITTVMRGLGQNPTEADIKAIMDRYDGDRNGRLDFEEFLRMIIDKINNPKEELQKAFKVFDRDGNGQINVDELKYVVNRLGDRFSDQEVEEMFAEADINNDGSINYEEFVLLMTEGKSS